MPRVAIVGGGWAGLAAAVELAAVGVPVVLCEAARQLGGRARSLTWGGALIDNGQHLLIGAYRETLRLAQRVGSADRLWRRRLRLILPEFELGLPRLPAPLHLAAGLATARGLGLGDKLAATRFMQALQRQAFRLPADTTVGVLLARHAQPPRLIDRLWAPICVAALNTPLEQASAQVFCNVLRDSLFAHRADSDFLFHQGPLAALLPEPAARFIARHGGEVRLGCKVEGIRQSASGWRLLGPEIEAQAVVVASHPARLPTLLGELPTLAPLLAQVRAYRWQPIDTTWLRFAEPFRLPYPMLALGGGQSPWVFDRQDLAPGLLSVVVSADGPHLNVEGSAWLKHLLERLQPLIGPLPRLIGHKRIIEKRATYACVPDLPRPDNRTPLPGLYLAGDYTRGDYPATLEGAVRSGIACARIITGQNSGRFE
ncbi:MAG: hydroxysqualene dehydroxylase HpnE [Thiobacillaceae bacterium]